MGTKLKRYLLLLGKKLKSYLKEEKNQLVS